MINVSIFRHFNCKFFPLLLDSSILKKSTILTCNKNINKYQQHDCPQVKKKIDYMSIYYDFSFFNQKTK